MMEVFSATQIKQKMQKLKMMKLTIGRPESVRLRSYAREDAETGSITAKLIQNILKDMESDITAELI